MTTKKTGPVELMREAVPLKTAAASDVQGMTEYCMELTQVSEGLLPSWRKPSRSRPDLGLAEPHGASAGQHARFAAALTRHSTVVECRHHKVSSLSQIYVIVSTCLHLDGEFLSLDLVVDIAVGEAVEKAAEMVFAVEVMEESVNMVPVFGITESAGQIEDMGVVPRGSSVGYSTDPERMLPDLEVAIRSVVGYLLLWEVLLRKCLLRIALSGRWTELTIHLRWGRGVAIPIDRRRHPSTTRNLLLRPELLLLLLLKIRCPGFD